MEAVEFYRIKPKFNSLFDAYGSLAVECFNIIQESENFTVTGYPTQEFFYNKYMTYFEELRREALHKIKIAPDLEYLQDRLESMNELIKAKKITSINKYELLLDIRSNPDKAVKYFEHLKNELDKLINLGLLNFTHLFLAYRSILYIAYERAVKTFDSASDPDKLITDLDQESLRFCKDYKNCKYLIIPFISPGGVYGFNTWLYLHFNDICTVGISLKPYAVHAGAYDQNPYRTTKHDLLHCDFGTDNLGKIVNKFNRKLYIKITSNQSKYEYRKVYIYILILFFMEHEVVLDEILRFIKRNEVEVFFSPRFAFGKEFKTFMTEERYTLYENKILMPTKKLWDFDIKRIENTNQPVKSNESTNIDSLLSSLDDMLNDEDFDIDSIPDRGYDTTDPFYNLPQANTFEEYIKSDNFFYQTLVEYMSELSEYVNKH